MRGWDRSFHTAAAAMLLGEAIYAVGLLCLHLALPALVGGPVSVQDSLWAGSIRSWCATPSS
jgi:hypothetical protein